MSLIILLLVTWGYCLQFSGKSSVLQSIIGLQILPDGIGTVTRCPIKIRLLRSQNEEFFVWNHHDDASKKDVHKVPKTENWSEGDDLIFYISLKIKFSWFLNKTLYQFLKKSHKQTFASVLNKNYRFKKWDHQAVKRKILEKQKELLIKENRVDSISMNECHVEYHSPKNPNLTGNTTALYNPLSR